MEQKVEPRASSGNTIITAKGPVSYEEIDDNVFKKLGYEIDVFSVPVPKLSFINEPQCNTVFEEWLQIAKVSEKYGQPPHEIPVERKKDFLLNGYSLEKKWYFDNRAVPKPRAWTQLKHWMELPESKLRSISNYGVHGMAILQALKHHSIAGKSGAVFGSETPWVEVYALKTGAKQVLTVEYQQTDIPVHNDKIKYIHPIELSQNASRYYDSLDFAISYSSLEHSGLGRYGDPMDPIGDLREVLKIKCLLKSGGLLFIGVPRGLDAVVYNAHRVYGRMRLAMLITGFEWLSTFRDNNQTPIAYTIEDLQTDPMKINQDLYVLKKL